LPIACSVPLTVMPPRSGVATARARSAFLRAAGWGRSDRKTSQRASPSGDRWRAFRRWCERGSEAVECHVGSRKLSIRNLFLGIARGDTTNQHRGFALARRKAAMPTARRARLAPVSGRSRQARCRGGLMSRSLRYLGNPRRIQKTTPVFPFAFRRNLPVRHTFFSASCGANGTSKQCRRVKIAVQTNQ
jgi:hypothetical protein